MRKTSLLDRHIKSRNGVAVTAKVDSATAISDNAIRVVAHFNRVPTEEECASKLESLFQGKVVAAPATFAVRRQKLGEVVIAGFMVGRPSVMSIHDIDENFHKVHANVYMDVRDQSVWSAENSHLIRQIEDDMAEVASLAVVKQNNRRVTDVALASVRRDFGNIQNTEVLSFFNVDTASFDVGVRVGADQVLSRENGLVTITPDVVIASRSLNGVDNPQAEIAGYDPAVDGYDVEQTVNYYQQLFGHDPEFWERLEAQIRNKAMA